MSTTPADRLARRGQPSLAMHLAICFAGAIALLALMLAFSEAGGEETAAEGAESQSSTSM